MNKEAKNATKWTALMIVLVGAVIGFCKLVMWLYQVSQTATLVGLVVLLVALIWLAIYLLQMPPIPSNRPSRSEYDGRWYK